MAALLPGGAVEAGACVAKGGMVRLRAGGSGLIVALPGRGLEGGVNALGTGGGAPPLSTTEYQGCRPIAPMRKSILLQMTCACAGGGKPQSQPAACRNAPAAQKQAVWAG